MVMPCAAQPRAFASAPCVPRLGVRPVRDVTVLATPSNGASSSETKVKERSQESQQAGWGELGPIGMTIGGGENGPKSEIDSMSDAQLSSAVVEERKKMKSIHSMSTEEWRAQYEQDGMIDLWVEEEFNAGSRIMGGRSVYKGDLYGQQTGEGPSAGQAPVHAVQIYDHRHDKVVNVQVPEDRYILWEAEDAGLELPYACRMGCCTACAVRVTEGDVWQPEALGISRALKEQGFALMCVGFPTSDCVMETIEDDEIYDMQFGKLFEEYATSKDSGAILRDDFALELAEMDE